MNSFSNFVVGASPMGVNGGKNDERFNCQLPFVNCQLILEILSVRQNKFNTRFKYYLLLMLFLAVVANGLLLKWELDFHRSIPIIQLFEADRVDMP